MKLSEDFKKCLFELLKSEGLVPRLSGHGKIRICYDMSVEGYKIVNVKKLENFR